jgi:fructokinase
MILVCGEALVDLYVGGPSASGLGCEAIAGGSPFNVAIGVARLGTPAAFLGGVSTDRFGEFLAETLEREGVETRFLVRTEKPTTISVVAMGADGHPRYSFYGAEAADRSVTPADLPAELGAEIRALVLGSYTLGVQPIGETLALLAERERGRRVISVDPNLRPTVVGDLSRWSLAFDRICRATTIIKASDEDIAVAYGPSVTIADAAARWLDAGVRAVVVTRGGKGAVAFGLGEPLELPGRRIDVVDTVGAGDTFHAALLTQLDGEGLLADPALGGLDRDALARAMQAAILASSITCTRRGADLPRAADIAAAKREAASP